MPAEYTPEEKMKKARIFLLQEQPFFGTIAHYLHMVQMNHLPFKTMATDGRSLFYDPDYAATKTITELKKSIMHEVGHVMFQHMNRQLGRKKMLWNYSCFPPGTVVEGHGPIEQIRTGDQVLGEHGQQKALLAPMARDYSGDLVNIRAVGVLPFRATPEHPILVAKRTNKRSPIKFAEPTWIEAGKIEERDFLAIPILKPNRSDSHIDIEKYCRDATEGIGGRERNRIKPSVKNGLELTSDIAWLMGIYAAEGSLTGVVNGHAISFNIALGGTESELKIAARVVEIVRELGYSSKIERITPTQTRVLVPSSILARMFTDLMGRGAKNKKIPDVILYHKNEKLVESFLDGLFRGDGCQELPQSRMISVTSRELVLGTQRLLTRFGDLGKVTVQIIPPGRILRGRVLPEETLYHVRWGNTGFYGKTRTMNGRTIRMHTIRWRVHGNYILTPVRKIVKEHYDGPVYNIKTEDHTYLVNNVVVHNCDFVINAMIANTKIQDAEPYTIPEGWLYDKKYENMTAEEVYNLLEKDGFELKCCQCPGSGTPSSRDGTGIPCDDPTHVHPFDETMPIPDDIAGDAAKRKDFENEWKLRFAKAAEVAKSRGLLPGGMEEYIKELMEPQVDWRSIIRNFLTSSAKNDYRWVPPNRRFLHSGTLMPSLKSEGGLVAFVVDTSGSMSIEDITKIVSEVKGACDMLPTMRVLLIACDAEVQSEQMIENSSEFPDRWVAKGRAGTSMPVAIRYVQQRMQNEGLEVKACLVCTDMMTDFGEEPQEFPVLWCTTVRGSVAPYGDTIQIKD